MKKYLIIALGILSILLKSNLYGQTSGKVLTVPPNEFASKLKSCATCKLIDIRTADEFFTGHLQNAVNIDWYAKDFETQISKLDKSKPVFIYCRSGGRSSSAAAKMKLLGFKEVIELDGGITKWQSSDLPVIK